MYIYRDTDGQPDDPVAGSPAPSLAEREAAYWYDLLAEEPAPEREETRGPFEPLVSSAGPPPGAAPQRPAHPDATGPAGPEADQPPAAAGHDQDLDETAEARARKLDRIKDLYLTAEAIGEQNVDKHFDELLARQRELISDYFRQSAAAQPAVTSPGDGLAADSDAEADADGGAEDRDVREPGGPRMADGQVSAPEGAGLAADPPRAW